MPIGDNQLYIVTVANKTINLTADGNDLMFFPKLESPKLEIQLLTWTILFIVVTSNTFVLKKMLKESKTFLDWPVVADCFLCFGTMLERIFKRFIIPACHLRLFLLACMSSTNRMITLAIVIYRYIYVVKWSWVTSSGKN